MRIPDVLVAGVPREIELPRGTRVRYLRGHHVLYLIVDSLVERLEPGDEIVIGGRGAIVAIGLGGGEVELELTSDGARGSIVVKVEPSPKVMPMVAAGEVVLRRGDVLSLETDEDVEVRILGRDGVREVSGEVRLREGTYVVLLSKYERHRVADLDVYVKVAEAGIVVKVV